MKAFTGCRCGAVLAMLPHHVRLRADHYALICSECGREERKQLSAKVRKALEQAGIAPLSEFEVEVFARLLRVREKLAQWA